MGGMLNKEGYQKLIDGDIKAIEKYMPEHSLEKDHIIDVLNLSTKRIYGSEGQKVETSNESVVCFHCKKKPPIEGFNFCLPCMADCVE